MTKEEQFKIMLKAFRTQEDVSDENKKFIKAYIRYCFYREPSEHFNDDILELNSLSKFIRNGDAYPETISLLGCINLITFTKVAIYNKTGNMDEATKVTMEVLEKYKKCSYLSEYIEWYKELFIDEYKYFSNLEMKIIISSAMKLAYRYIYDNDYSFSDWIEYNDVYNDMMSTWIAQIISQSVDLEIDRDYAWICE